MRALLQFLPLSACLWCYSAEASALEEGDEGSLLQLKRQLSRPPRSVEWPVDGASAQGPSLLDNFTFTPWGYANWLGGHVQLPNDRCPEKCVSYPNLIRIDPTDTCSFLDRVANIKVWSQVASLLCARIVFPPPCTQLSLSLLAGEMAADVEWSHYLNVTMVSDNTSLFNEPTSTAQDRRKLISELTAPVFQDQWEDAKASFENGHAFQWTLSGAEWYLDQYRVIPVEEFSCYTTLLSPSDGMLDILQRFYDTLSLRKGNFVALNLRQNDCEHCCDTGIGATVDYVKCAMEKSGWSNRADQPIVIFTDSADEAYKTELVNTLSDVYAGRRKVALGEPILNNLTANSDPAMVFAVSILARIEAEGELLRDRNACDVCSAARLPGQHGNNFESYAMYAAAIAQRMYATTDTLSIPACKTGFL